MHAVEHCAGQVMLPSQALGPHVTEQPQDLEQLMLPWQELWPQVTVHMPVPQVMSLWQAVPLDGLQITSQVVDLEQLMLPWQEL